MTRPLSRLEHAPSGSETAAPLVIAHGLFGSARNFNTLGRKLATNRRVVMVDMPNHGDSPWTEDMTYPAMAEDLARVIDDEGGRAVLLGHSMGGKAAMALALLHPGLLAGVVVADIAPVAYAHTHMPYIQAMRAMDLSGVTRRSDAEPMLADAVADPMLRAFLLQNLLVQDGTARWRINLPALENAMSDLTGWPAELSDKTFDGPALFVYGGRSDYMSKLIEPRVREHFPRAQFHRIDDAGHWLHAEQPAAFQAAVADWLARL